MSEPSAREGLAAWFVAAFAVSLFGEGVQYLVSPSTSVGPDGWRNFGPIELVFLTVGVALAVVGLLKEFVDTWRRDR